MGAGSYSIEMTGLLSSKTYHVRAYAINGMGTAYGDDVSFKTKSGGAFLYNFI
jgi:hypothetical protein